MKSQKHPYLFAFLALSLLLAACGPVQVAEQAGAAKIPITTASNEARDLFLKGRDLQDRLRGTDAHEYFVQAVALDPDFAWAHLLVGFTGSTAQGFFDSLERAVTAVDQASEGERHLILAANAGVKGDPEGQLSHWKQLVEAYPEDERAHNGMGIYHFIRQEYDAAVEHFGHGFTMR